MLGIGGIDGHFPVPVAFPRGHQQTEERLSGSLNIADFQIVTLLRANLHMDPFEGENAVEIFGHLLDTDSDRAVGVCFRFEGAILTSVKVQPCQKHFLFRSVSVDCRDRRQTCRPHRYRE